MSHSRGWLVSCSGTWQPYGRQGTGVKQERCSKCGTLRTRQVRPCLFLHRWKNKGKRRYGVQKQQCRRCGTLRETQARPCLFFHLMSTLRREPVPRCIRCGEYGIDSFVPEDEYV